MAARMRAARLHQPGQPLRVDEVERPKPRAGDVLIAVKSCGVIPNMNAIFSGTLWNHLPPLPASVCLDAAGVVAEVGDNVNVVRVGDRVYVNPWLSCGSCPYCRSGEPMLCSSAAFQGYFGFFKHSLRLLAAYPYGGFSQYMTASASRLVLLPPEVNFDHAARFGYIGTSFAALRAGKVGAGSWVAINGITGTLGVAAALLALAMGATRILGFGRNRGVLGQLRALASNRVDTLALGDAPIADWLRERTEGLGVDLLIDCSARAASASATAEALNALKRGGCAINIGALTEPLPLEPIRFMTSRLHFRGSNWFTTGEGQLMAEMVRAGVLDLSSIKSKAFPLDQVNQALDAVKQRPGGFTNIVVNPDR
ncbi:MAG TPA: alcohol dehydrogenase catalytic domain-containing protein [Xanthobacteraceae bacterium]